MATIYWDISLDGLNYLNSTWFDLELIFKAKLGCSS